MLDTVDNDLVGKLLINIDLTVAMPCAFIGADFIDADNNAVTSNSEKTGLKEEDCLFEMDPARRDDWILGKKLNNFLSEKYHAIFKTLWANRFSSWFNPFPDVSHKMSKHSLKRIVQSGKIPDACRIYGSVQMEKNRRQLPHPARQIASPPQISRSFITIRWRRIGKFLT